MVRTYVKKTGQGQWSHDSMQEAANEVLLKQITMRQAAEKYKVPFTSLQRRVTLSRGVVKHRGGQPILDTDIEKKFADRLLTSPQNKNNLLEKEAKKNKREIEKTNFEKKGKGEAKKNMTKKKNKATPGLKVKRSAPSRDWHCIYCSEKFVHPPAEDWIQCIVCEEWCHEKCTDREGAKGPYTCDLHNN